MTQPQATELLSDDEIAVCLGRSLDAVGNIDPAKFARAIESHLSSKREGEAGEKRAIYGGKTAFEFIGGALFDFQQATGCDTAEEYLEQTNATPQPSTKQDSQTLKWDSSERMPDHIRSFIEGMSVSVDASTCDEDGYAWAIKDDYGDWVNPTMHRLGLKAKQQVEIVE